jgi:hypothetical protein
LQLCTTPHLHLAPEGRSAPTPYHPKSRCKIKRSTPPLPPFPSVQHPPRPPACFTCMVGVFQATQTQPAVRNGPMASRGAWGPMLALIAPQAQRGARREASLREKFFPPNKTHQVECFALDLRHALTQASPHALTAQNRCCSSSENQSCAPWFQPPTQLKVATRVHTYTCSAKSAPHPASHPLQRRQPPAALSALQRQKVQTCGFRPKAPPPDQTRVSFTAARGQSRDPRCFPSKKSASHNPSGEFPTCSLGSEKSGWDQATKTPRAPRPAPPPSQGPDTDCTGGRG